MQASAAGKKYWPYTLGIVAIAGLYWLFAHYILGFEWQQATISNPMNFLFLVQLSAVFVAWLIYKRESKGVADPNP